MNSPAKKTYLISAAFLVAILLAAFISSFLISQIRAESNKMFEAKQELNSFNQNWRNLNTTKQESATIKDQLAQKTALLPTEDAINFILAVESSAQTTQNRETISVTPPPAKVDTNAKNTIDFQISLWGNFPNLIKFLIYLENAPYLNSVNSLTIRRLTEADLGSADAAGSQAGDVNSVINLSTYQ